RVAIGLSRALTIALFALSAVPFAQTPARAPKPTDAKPVNTWTTPRTPWGDPELQGVFTTSNEYATPLERPEQFAGRRLDDITDEELAGIRRTAEQRMVDALTGGGVCAPGA